MKLSETRDKNGKIIPSKLDQFIAEHKDATGDEAAFNRTVEAMAGKSKEAPEASSQGGSDD